MNKKLLAILMALCSIFLISGLAACNVDDPNTSINTNNAGKYVVELDLSGFSHDVGLNREFNYESIKFRCVGLQPTNSLTNNENFEEFIVEAKEYMVLSGGETDTLGEKEIVILYDREVYVISYTVKYQVDYLAFGEVYASQFVLSADEITTIPTPPAINGYTFANYLDSEIPAEITDNIQLDVHFYNDSLKAPALQRVESSYEPNMSIAVKDVELPSNENGEWVYVDDSVVITTAGEHLVDVEFIPANDQVAPRSDKLAINVAPKKAEFTITTSESFVYDGASHFPSYSVTDDIEVEVVGEPQVSAGTYTYALLVANSNYEGFYTGSFEITKPSVTISVSDKEMKYGEAVPAVEYTVTGFENLSILGINEVKPSVTAIGNYELTVTVSNTNVNLTINKGNLSVAKGDLLEVADPVLSTESVPAVYEDTLSVVTLTGDYRGKWAWAQPDLVINSVTSFTATAVFTPNNTNYNLIEREITITNIEKRTLEITVTGCNYVYSGEDYTIVYEIQEGKNLVVDGNIVQSTAGTYETVLTINDEFYKGSVKATLFIDKDIPETNFTPTFERKWSSTLTLSEIELPEGYSWNNPTTKLANIETNEYEATFTPSDTTNYYTVAGKFSVTVIKADGILHGVEESYEFIYKNQAYSLSGITSTPSDGKITYTYLLDGEKVDEILLPGTYEVIIDLAESTYYTACQERTTAVVVKLPSTEVVPALTQSSASYTGSDITVVVRIEQEIDFTVSSSDEGVLVNGKTVTVKNAGTYTITLTLDEEALYLYKWFDQEETNLSTTCTFTVNSIDNDFNSNVNISDLLGENHSYENEEFTRLYDGSESIIDLTKFESLTNYGTPVVTYYSEANGVRTKLADGTYPKDAGSYVVVLSVAASQNYNAFSYEIKLTISKLATVITVPTYNTAQYQKSAEAAKDKGYNYSTAPKAILESTGEEVFGTFVYGDLEFNHLSGAESTYVITFIPNDPSYAESTAIATINLIDIAYHLDTTSGAKEYYGTLEDALDTVTSGEIWVYPNAKGATINYAVTIDRDVTIASGVTLVIPYGTKASPVRNTDALCSMGDTYANKEATISNRQTSVVVSSNVTLTVNGTLEIAGALGGGGSQCRYAGQTYSSYAELYLEDNAHVNIYGVVKLTGFIEGPDGKITVETNGTIYLPFVYCDHRGGNYLSKVKSTGKNLSPFNRYQFRNIRNATLEMRYSSTMKAYVNLYASGLNSQHAGHSEVLFIGKGGVIELLTEYSYLTAVFDPFNSKCDLRVYGNAQTNDLTISLQMDSTPINLTSKDFDFPIPWNYDISLNKVAGNTDAKNGQFTMGSVYKLLPGSNFTVEEGATLTLEKMILYTSMHTVVGGDTNRPYYDYYNYNDGASVTTTNFSVIPAKFTVNGTLIANYFGGKIYTNVKGATVQIKSGSSVSVNEVTEYKYSSGGYLSTIKHAPVTNTLELVKAGNSGESYSATGTYYSTGSAWYSANYTISYNHNGGSSVANNISVTNGISGYTLTDTDLPTTSTRTHYTFDHWCLNSECEDMNCAGVSAGQVLYGDHVLYAIWSANEYTMNFVNKLPDGSEVATNAQSIKFTILSDLALPGEPASPSAGYNFSGWYTADGTQLATIVGANFVDYALENGNAVTIYAHWTNETVYEVIIETNTTDADFADSSTQATSSLTLPDLSGKNIDTTYNKYFAGWYVDSALTVPYESFEQLKACAPTGSDNQRTIYAKWANKITITTTSADDADDSDGTYSAKYTIKFSETNSGGYFTSDELVKTGGSWYIIPGHYVYLNATESSSISGITNKSYTQFSANATIKVNYDTKDKASGGSCFTGDTLITLADGSQKRADQVTLEDALLVFNHETGKLEGVGIIFIENDGFADYNVIHLEFSDGRTTKLIYEHGYFDITLNKYVYVDESNFASFIGHEFAVLAGDSYETVTLTNAYLVNEYASCYSLVTVYHLNYFVDGLFSMPGGIEGLFNMFAFGEGLVYDQESMLADIQTYGLYSYEDFAPYLPYEVYAAFPADYLKVSVGKGMITFEEILGYIEKYLVKNDVI